MNILYITPYVPSRIRVRPYQLIRQLAARHAITLLAVGQPGDLDDDGELQAACRRIEIVPTTTLSQARSCASGAWRGAPLQAVVSHSPALRSRLASLLTETQFDVVHIEHLRAADLGAALPRSLPTVYDAVDCISLLLQRTRASSHCRRQRLLATIEEERTRRYEGQLLRRFDQVAVTAAEDQAALSDMAPGRPVTVVPNGVDLDYFRPSASEREPATLVFSGKMSYHANTTAVVHFVNEILPLIRQARPDVRLRIVGSRPPAGLMALARDPAIEITGYLPDIRPSLASATIAICPITVKVGIQNKLLEAMAMGLPVVCTAAAFGGLQAMPERDLLVAQTSADFAAQVVGLLADPARQRALGQAGRHYVEAVHRWEDAARAFEALYDRAIVGHAAARSQPAPSVALA